MIGSFNGKKGHPNLERLREGRGGYGGWGRGDLNLVDTPPAEYEEHTDDDVRAGMGEWGSGHTYRGAVIVNSEFG